MGRKTWYITTKSKYDTLKFSADADNTTYTIGDSTDIMTGTPDIEYMHKAYLIFNGSIWHRGYIYGKSGQGIQGEKGDKGDKGDTGAAGADGHSPSITATKNDGVTTIAVDGTAIAIINDGAKGETGNSHLSSYSASNTVQNNDTTIPTGKAVETFVENKGYIVDTDSRLTDSRPANGGNSDTVNGYHLVVTTTAGTSANTIYFII